MKHMEDKVRRELKIMQLVTYPHIVRLYRIIETPSDIYVENMPIPARYFPFPKPSSTPFRNSVSTLVDESAALVVLPRWRSRPCCSRCPLAGVGHGSTVLGTRVLRWRALRVRPH